jgi:hypothetical protein
LQDFLALEVTPVSNNGQIFDAGSGSRLPGHVRQLVTIIAKIGDLVRHDQMRRGINGGLNVVANHPCSPTAGGHGACVRISQRDLSIG